MRVEVKSRWRAVGFDSEVGARLGRGWGNSGGGGGPGAADMLAKLELVVDMDEDVSTKAGRDAQIETFLERCRAAGTARVLSQGRQSFDGGRLADNRDTTGCSSLGFTVETLLCALGGESGASFRGGRDPQAGVRRPSRTSNLDPFTTSKEPFDTALGASWTLW